MAQKKVTLLGSTGSIGTQALEVIDRHCDELAVEALVFGSNVKVAVEQALRFRPRVVVTGEERLYKELKQALHPQVVAPVRMDGKVVNHETIRATNVYVAAYIFIFAASFMLVSLDGFDMVTNFTSIAATLNNIGPGLNQVGPMMNFGAYSNFAKLVLIFDMLAGRLEIFPMLVLFMPDTWRRF